jgi:hypothetical protein
MPFLTLEVIATLADARAYASEVARDEAFTVALLFRPRREAEGLWLQLRGVQGVDDVAGVLMRHGFKGGPGVDDGLDLIEPVHATDQAAERARDYLRRRIAAVIEELGQGAVREERGDAEVYERGDLDSLPRDAGPVSGADPEGRISITFLFRGSDRQVRAASELATRSAAELHARRRSRARSDVRRVLDELEKSRPSDYDWRDEFACELCRSWTGTLPVPIDAVEQLVREKLPDLTEARVSRACYLCVDAEGNGHHIPTTMLEWSGGSYQWFPELPPDHLEPRARD